MGEDAHEGVAGVSVVDAGDDAVATVVDAARSELDHDRVVLVSGTDAGLLAQVAARLPAAAAASSAASAGDPSPFPWLPLPVRGECPLTADELRRLVVLESRHTLERERRGRQLFPDEEDVPTAAEARDLADRMARAVLAGRQLDPSLRDLLERPDADALLEAIRALNARLGDLLGRGRSWVVRVADRALAEPGATAWADLAGHAGSIDRVIAAHGELRGTTVEGVVNSEAGLRAVSAVAERLAAGEQLKRRFRGRAQRAAAPYLDAALVDGAPVTDAEGVAAVRAHLEAHAAMAALHAELAPLGVPVPTEGPREAVVAELLGIREALRAVERLVAAARRLDELLAVEADSEVAAAFELRSLDDVDRVRWAGDALAAVRDGERAREDIESAVRALEAVSADADQTGDPATEPAPEIAELVLCLRAADAAAYAEWLGRLENGRRTHRLAALRDELRDRLGAGAPALVPLIEADPAEESWASRLPRWAEAWAWARVATERSRPPVSRVLPLPAVLADPGATVGVDVLVLHDPQRAHLEEAARLSRAARVVVVAGPATEGVRPGEPAGPTTSVGPEHPPPPAEGEAPDEPRDVVLALADRGPVSSADVRAATGLSAARVRTLLKRLVDEGELTRTGATSATRWHRAGSRPS